MISGFLYLEGGTSEAGVRLKEAYAAVVNHDVNLPTGQRVFVRCPEEFHFAVGLFIGRDMKRNRAVDSAAIIDAANAVQKNAVKPVIV